MDRLFGAALAVIGAYAALRPEFLRQADHWPSASLAGYRLVGAVACIIGLIVAIFGVQFESPNRVGCFLCQGK